MQRWWKKTYRMEDKAGQRRLRELVEQIPLDHLRLTEELLVRIQAAVRQPLNESLLITLADHISFAIRRKEQGIEFKNPLAGSILCYYPTEYQLGQQCLEQIRQTCGVALNTRYLRVLHCAAYRQCGTEHQHERNV